MIIEYYFYAMLKFSYLAVFFYILMVTILPISFLFFVLITYYFNKKHRIPFFIFTPFLWVIAENLKTYGDFRFTSDHLACFMANKPYLIQFMDITGPYGVGFWLILANALIFEAIISYRRRGRWILSSVAALLIVILPSLYGLYQWKTLKFSPDLEITMLQPNISLEKKLNKEYKPEIMNALRLITLEAIKEKPDLLIWPETAYPFPVVHWIDKTETPSLPEVSALARDSATPMLVGVEYGRIKTKQDFDIYNAALLIDDQGNISDYYGKIYLVPFTEGLPFKELLGIKRMGKRGLIARLGGFSAGDRFTIFEFERRKRQEIEEIQPKDKSEDDGKIRFGVLICYEGIYPELSRSFRNKGVDFLVCITNDAWFGKTRLPYWHADTLRLRAIENRISIARSANTGVTCFVDPTGRMYQSSDIFTREIVSGSISTEEWQTIYTKYGDVLVFVSYPVIVLLFLFCSILIKKSK
jgi:apolipoprotein N-acyltransferase